MPFLFPSLDLSFQKTPVLPVIQIPHALRSITQYCPSMTFQWGQSFIYHFPILTFHNQKVAYDWKYNQDIVEPSAWASVFCGPYKPSSLPPQTEVRRRVLSWGSPWLGAPKIPAVCIYAAYLFSCLARFQFLKVFSSNKLRVGGKFALQNLTTRYWILSVF